MDDRGTRTPFPRLHVTAPFRLEMPLIGEDLSKVITLEIYSFSKARERNDD